VGETLSSVSVTSSSASNQSKYAGPFHSYLALEVVALAAGAHK
jgi:hypothetical protein